MAIGLQSNRFDSMATTAATDTDVCRWVDLYLVGSSPAETARGRGQNDNREVALSLSLSALTLEDGTMSVSPTDAFGRMSEGSRGRRAQSHYRRQTTGGGGGGRRHASVRGTRCSSFGRLDYHRLIDLA